jgi:hypothetical protein
MKVPVFWITFGIFSAATKVSIPFVFQNLADRYRNRARARVRARARLSFLSPPPQFFRARARTRARARMGHGIPTFQVLWV